MEEEKNLVEALPLKVKLQVNTKEKNVTMIEAVKKSLVEVLPPKGLVVVLLPEGLVKALLLEGRVNALRPEGLVEALPPKVWLQLNHKITTIPPDGTPMTSSTSVEEFLSPNTPGEWMKTDSSTAAMITLTRNRTSGTDKGAKDIV